MISYTRVQDSLKSYRKGWEEKKIWFHLFSLKKDKLQIFAKWIFFSIYDDKKSIK